MHIALIMAGDEEGGLEKHVEELANELSRTCLVSVIAHKKYRDRFLPNVQFFEFNLARSRNNPWLLMQLINLIKRINPSLIHAQANKAAALVARIKPWINCPAIATIHGIKNRQYFLRHFEAVIGVSNAVCQRIPNHNRHVVYNGIQKPTPSHRSVDVKPRPRPVFAAIGRMVPVKGFDILLKAWKTIPADLWLIGDGPERAALQKIINTDPHLQKRVQLLGYRRDIANLIDQADAVIISSYREGFSYVFAEAMLLDTPVLATDVAIANEVLPTQYLCPVGKADALENLVTKHLHKLRRTAGNKPSADKTELQAEFEPYFAWARSQLTLSSMVTHTQEVYHTLLHSTKAGR